MMLDDLACRLQTARPLVLLLDYDGTLVPIAAAPELALPDPDLLSLLEALAARPSTSVHVVSGRPREALEDWFGAIPVSLWAEHGFWHRSAAPRGTWECAGLPADDAVNRLMPLLEQFTANTPGAIIERKTASVAWHYRMADVQFGARQARELRILLSEALSNQPLEVLEGKKVIEVRLRGVSKALVARRVLQTAAETSAILAIGDDRTDEDMFRALPNHAISVSVGRALRGSAYELDSPAAVRALLRTLVTPSDFPTA